MKKQARRGVLNLMAGIARAIVSKYRPIIVGITGSVGKTTTQAAVVAVLREAFPVMTNDTHATSEWGVLAAILAPGDHSFYRTGKSGWTEITAAGIFRLMFLGMTKVVFAVKYPKLFVLEMGIDHPGDMAFFNSFLKLDVAVVTNVGTAHREFFGSKEDLISEKISIFRGLKKNGLAILGEDQEEVRRLVEKEINPVRLLTISGQKIEVKLPDGRQWPPAAAVAEQVGAEFALTDEQIESGISKLSPIPGRFEANRLNRGIVLVDDSYNSSLSAVRLGMEGLSDLGAGRKVAILGGMRELGAVHNEAHTSVGEGAAKTVDLLITLGADGKLIADGARKAGMASDKIIELVWSDGDTNTRAVVDTILGILQDNDKVLIKASRSVGLAKLAHDLTFAIGFDHAQ